MKKKIGIVSLWILQILLAFVFTQVGRDKFANPFWEKYFRAWGYPEHFREFVGVVEGASGLAMLTPWTAPYGAAAAITIMTGALGHHLMRGEFRRAASPLVFLVFFGIAGWARRPKFMRRETAGAT